MKPNESNKSRLKINHTPWSKIISLGVLRLINRPGFSQMVQVKYGCGTKTEHHCSHLNFVLSKRFQLNSFPNELKDFMSKFIDLILKYHF